MQTSRFAKIQQEIRPTFLKTNKSFKKVQTEVVVLSKVFINCFIVFYSNLN